MDWDEEYAAVVSLDRRRPERAMLLDDIDCEVPMPIAAPLLQTHHSGVDIAMDLIGWDGGLHFSDLVGTHRDDTDEGSALSM